MFVLSSDITIGSANFSSVHSVEVERSINKINATAKIHLPVTARLKQKDELGTRTETAKIFKVGDPVKISLGYDNRLNTEFIGYVRQINLTSPIEIICEDSFYLLRQKNVIFSSENTTLKQCLNTILEGLKIEIAHCIDLTLKNFVVDNKPASWVLNKLKTDYGLTIFFDVQNRLYVGRLYDVIGERVKYKMRYNVINDEELQFMSSEDVKLQIKAICFYADGTKIEATIGGNGGEQKSLYFYDVESLDELAVLAKAELLRYQYDGFRGKIETFLLPYVVPGMVAVIEDPHYPERSGNYYVESVETSYNDSGGRRNVSIGIKV